MNTNIGYGFGETHLQGRDRHRFGGTLDSIAAGLMALLLSAVTVGAFVHEWRPSGPQVESIARYHDGLRSPRG
jgi:hypothetical protein